MKLTVLAALAVAAFGQPPPKRLYVDPASRWESLHDTDGSGARNEMTADLLKACPLVVSVTETREAADYTMTVIRTTGSGTLVIYAGGTAVHSSKPGFGSSLRKISETVCAFIGARK